MGVWGTPSYRRVRAILLYWIRGPRGKSGAGDFERVSGFTIQQLLGLLQDRGGSDLILTAGQRPQLRVLGALEPVETTPLTAEQSRELAYSLLEPAQIQALETTRYLDFSKAFGTARFRFSVYHQRDSVALAARLIPSQIPSFAELGLPPVIAELASLPHGLVLITGPAGSGKSTTLAAMLDYINHRRQAHIICIEDPIEYIHQHERCTIAQREIGTDARSFPEALRSVFRQTPDVIMIGEMRDLETMQLALTLAETGHLILSTLHTQDATHAVNRIADSFPSNQQEQVYMQLSLVLMGVVSQQLLRTKDMRRRVLACEVMKVNHAIRNLIREAEVQQIYSVIQTGKADDMTTMNESLLQLCRLDLVDTDTALARSPRPKELRQLLELRVPARRGG